VANTKAATNRNEAISKDLALRPMESEKFLLGLTPSKNCIIKKQLKGSARAPPPGAGLSLKSQIMEQIFDI
jgi:hypothetical protein